MNSKAIGVWLSIALLGVVLYMLPAVMKQLFFMKEQFVSQMDSGDWRGEVLRSVGNLGSASEPEPSANPSYLQNVPSASRDFEVGGAGGDSLESQPASVDFGTDGLTPMQMQGMQMKKAPASGNVEGFEAAGPGASVPGPGASAPGPGSSSGSGAASGSSAGTPSASCTPQLTYNPKGPPTYTCDGKVIDTPIDKIPAMPAWLKSTTTKDGIDSDEAAIMNYWIANSDNNEMPSWVADMASAETLTPSEKKAFASWAKDNTKTSETIVKPTVGKGSTSSTDSSTSDSDSSCKPACKPKPKTKCKSKAEQASEETKQCKGPVDMGDYIRKDSIPCWACKL
jgi:hypothetical protein